MKCVFAAFAAVTLLATGCGASAEAPETEEQLSASQPLAVCPGSLPDCASLEGNLCKPSGATQACCEGSIATHCGCSSTFKWVCP